MLSKEEHIARLIFLHIQGMTDNAQEKELNEWRSVSPRHEELFQRMLSSEHVEKSISRFVKTEEEEAKNRAADTEKLRLHTLQPCAAVFTPAAKLQKT